MTLAGSASAPQPLAGRHFRVVIVGGGFGGVGVAAGLRRAGIEDFVLLEKAGALGGTWRDNTYPGCACDVPSHLYSFSFARNPRWPRSFSRQPDILRYLQDVADRFDLRRHVRLGVELLDARWDDGAGHWRLRTGAGELTAGSLVMATGPLSTPKIPDWPGLETFTGDVFHSAAWRHDLDLTDRRVAVVGTGASAVQFVPRIQPVVARLHLFQRTPAWVLPRFDRPLTRPERAVFARAAGAQLMARAADYALREIDVVGFVVQPAVLRAASCVGRAWLRYQVRDAALRARLTPRYRMGCKRILLSNDFYPAVARPNVEVVASGVTRVGPRSVTAADGTERQVDAIILGTGFHVTDFPIARRIHGRGGAGLHDKWEAEGARALRGTTVDGFPNLYLVIGPNTILAHSSMIYIIESQVPYIVDGVRAVGPGRATAIEPTPEAMRRWNADLAARMAGTVWATGGCASWYMDARGRITAQWPGSTFRFRRATRRLDLSEYRATPVGAGDVAAAGGPVRPWARRSWRRQCLRRVAPPS